MIGSSASDRARAMTSSVVPAEKGHVDPDGPRWQTLEGRPPVPAAPSTIGDRPCHHPPSRYVIESPSPRWALWPVSASGGPTCRKLGQRLASLRSGVAPRHVAISQVCRGMAEHGQHLPQGRDLADDLRRDSHVPGPDDAASACHDLGRQGGDLRHGRRWHRLGEPAPACGGIRAGDTVAILVDNPIRDVIATLALLQMGVVSASIRVDQLADLGRLGAAAVVTSSATVGLGPRARVVMGDDWFGPTDLAKPPDEREFRRCGPCLAASP